MLNKFLLLAMLCVAVAFAGHQRRIALALPPDTTPPTLVAFDFNPKTVNTSATSQTITFTAHIVDSPAGNNPSGPTQFQFHSPSGNQYVIGLFYGDQLVSGSLQDGYYSYTATLPAFSEAGTWHLFSFLLGDAATNNVWLNESQVAALGFPTTFVQSGAGDTSAPTLVSFDYSPKTFNTSAASQTITFTAHIVDAPAGNNPSGPTQFQFHSPSGNQYVIGLFYGDQLVSGSLQDGYYSYTATLPAFSEAGTWHLFSFLLGDAATNNV